MFYNANKSQIITDLLIEKSLTDNCNTEFIYIKVKEKFISKLPESVLNDSEWHLIPRFLLEDLQKKYYNVIPAYSVKDLYKLVPRKIRGYDLDIDLYGISYVGDDGWDNNVFLYNKRGNIKDLLLDVYIKVLNGELY